MGSSPVPTEATPWSHPGPGVSGALTYTDAVHEILSRPRLGISAGLERTGSLVDALGCDPSGFRGVLVAGTNGKGSVCALVESIARRSGATTVRLTKPHLRDWRERIAVNGETVSEAEFADLAAEVLTAAERMDLSSGPASRFEILTGIGILAAHRHRPDVLVCEVGVGGRLDSTNVLDLGACAIAQIGLDHAEFLGTTIAAVATEKAAIIKPGNSVVTATGAAEADVVVGARCEEVGAQLRRVGDDIQVSVAGHSWSGLELAVQLPGHSIAVRSGLLGRHQAANVALALGVWEQIGSWSDDAVRAGVAETRWPARLERRGNVIVDGAHNPAAMAALADALQELEGDRPVVAVFAAMADKDVGAMLRELSRLTSRVIMTTVADERSADPTDLATAHGPGAEVVRDPQEALAAAERIAGERAVVVVCGSLALAGALS